MEIYWLFSTIHIKIITQFGENKTKVRCHIISIIRSFISLKCLSYRMWEKGTVQLNLNQNRELFRNIHIYNHLWQTAITFCLHLPTFGLQLAIIYTNNIRNGQWNKTSSVLLTRFNHFQLTDNWSYKRKTSVYFKLSIRQCDLSPRFFIILVSIEVLMGKTASFRVSKFQ